MGRLASIIVALAALGAIGFGLVRLEGARAGLDVSHMNVGDTPITVMRPARQQGPVPVVVIAHGFAGSQQLMQPFQITLARAGYIAVSFDFEGHGRNPVPMSGDVNAIEGTTRLLMAETGRVTDAAVALPGADGRVALLGHSMASDIVVRQALEDNRVEAVIGISLFSEAVTADEPAHLLIVNGQWETLLRDEARRIMEEQGADEGETVGDPALGFARRAVAAPMVEHVGVLYSRTALVEARNWLNGVFARTGDGGEAMIGGPILLALLGVVLLGVALARALPQGAAPAPLPGRLFWALAIGPAILTPLALALVDTRFLPVLVADYLAVHLGVYGALVLTGFAVAGGAPRLRLWWAGLFLAVFALASFGAILDRYVASFWPHAGRWPILAAILPGAVLAMVADASLLQAGRARIWRRWGARLAFLASLGLAVALDFERLFFLIIILPVIVLFYLTFGVMGGAVGRRTGSVMAMGVGLGIVLAWALAVTFPMFDGTT